METTLLVAGGIVVLVVLVAWALNRAWGSGPQLPSINQHKHDTPLQPPASRSPSFGWEQDKPALSATAAPVQPPQPRSYAPILITNPRFRAIAEQTLQKPDSKEAQYFTRNGDDIYLIFDQISDPRQRDMLHQVATSFTTNQHLGALEMMKLMAQIFNKR